MPADPTMVRVHARTVHKMSSYDYLEELKGIMEMEGEKENEEKNSVPGFVLPNHLHDKVSKPAAGDEGSKTEFKLELPEIK